MISSQVFILKAYSVFAHHPCKKMMKIFVSPEIDYLISFHKLTWCYFTELHIIFSSHSYIKVVIPWNISGMSYCSKQCSPFRIISYVIFSAYSVNLIKHIKFSCPSSFYHRWYIKSISYFIFKIFFWKLKHTFSSLYINIFYHNRLPLIPAHLCFCSCLSIESITCINSSF